jgi:hypothetical protein
VESDQSRCACRGEGCDLARNHRSPPLRAQNESILDQKLNLTVATEYMLQVCDAIAESLGLLLLSAQQQQPRRKEQQLGCK